MIKKLQQKFILIAMISLFLVIIFIVGVINSVMAYKINEQADFLLRILSENNGEFPQNEIMLKQDKNWITRMVISEETRFETRYFTVFSAYDGTVKVDIDNIAAISAIDAKEYADYIIDTGRKTGYSGSYKYLVSEREEGVLVIFVDCNLLQETQDSILFISFVIAGVSLLIMFLLVSFFSKKAIQPLLENVEKQKQFITDASHEIKTPLAIISANTDVLEITLGKNQWLESTRNQTLRLNELVKDLLTLSKMEEQNEVMMRTSFSMSDMVKRIAEPFASIAESSNRTFELQVEPDLQLLGDQNGIEKLISVLVDNAMKYATEQGVIQVVLKKQGKYIKLEVCNSCELDSNVKLNRLFDRFYRMDSSRARETGGSGIGLSIAKAIVDSHKGKIRAYLKNDQVICFSVLLS